MPRNPFPGTGILALREPLLTLFPAQNRGPVRPGFLLGLTLTLLTLASYWPVTGYGFVNYDDSVYVYDNPHVCFGLSWNSIVWAFSKSHSANWHPLTWISHMIDCQLYGLNAGGHHLSSLILHILNALLLFLVLLRATGARWRCGMVAALFALHPLHVESVAWVAERKDVLSTLFMLLALGAYCRYTGRRSARAYCLALAFFSLGLMCKPMVVTLPFLFLLLDFWPLNRVPLPANAALRACALPEVSGPRCSWGRLLGEKVPFLLLSAASCVVTYQTQLAGGAVTFRFPLGVRIANAAVAYVLYIKKMFLPFDLCVAYQYQWPIPWVTLAVCGAILVVLSACVVMKFRRYPWLLVGWLWFLGTLVPVIGIVQVGEQPMADRYSYVPLVGLFVPIVWGLALAARTLRLPRSALIAASCVLLAALALVTRKQVSFWENGGALFSRAIAVCSGNAVAHNNLGGYYLRRGISDSARASFGEALRLRPGFVFPAYNLGLVAASRDSLNAAIRWFRTALSFDSSYADAYQGLGNALAAMGEDSSAIVNYRAAIRWKPDFWLAQKCLGAAFYRQGMLDSAVQHLQLAISIYRDQWEVENLLGLSLARSNKPGMAAIHFAKAIAIRSDAWEPYCNVGNLLLMERKYRRALGSFSYAIALNGSVTPPFAGRAEAYAALGFRDSAMADARAALILEPASVALAKRLGAILAEDTTGRELTPADPGIDR